MKKERGDFKCQGANQFNDFINQTCLLDPNTGGHYTWISNDGSKFNKLDKFLISLNTYCLWPNSNVIALNKLFSDHCLILIGSNSSDYGLVPFRLFNSWLNLDELTDVLQMEWNKTNDSLQVVSVIEMLYRKLGFLKKCYQNMEVY